jgi:TPR repeat protein
MVVWVLSIFRRDAGQGMPPRWGLLLAVLWVGGLLGCPPHRAGPLGEGPTAVALLQQQAVRGEREAQYRLGLLALTGEGVPHDARVAVQWLQRAAAQGHPEAQRLLGQLSLTGQGLPRNATAAAAWYRRAAEQGDSEAQWQLGRLYQVGQGVPRNEAEAAAWYRRAAEHGDPERQWHLGLKYLHGWGVPQDSVQAYLWLSLAAAHLPAGPLREQATRASRHAAQKLTPAQWTRAQALVRQWQSRTAP